jgi:hypothetical protein
MMGELESSLSDDSITKQEKDLVIKEGYEAIQAIFGLLETIKNNKK